MEISYHTIDAKDGTNINTSINITATIQGIKDNDILPAPFNYNSLIVFLGYHHLDFTRSLEAVDENLIGQDIELFDIFALDILHPRQPGSRGVSIPKPR